jgi:hypothetical protein
MSSIYDAFKTDSDAEQNGIDLDFGDFKVTIARSGGANKKYETLVRQKLDRYKRAIAFNALPEEIAKKVLIECFAEAVVLGWEGVMDENGLTIDFSVTNCIKLFTELPEFFTQVREESEKIGNFLVAKRKAAAGN